MKARKESVVFAALAAVALSSFADADVYGNEIIAYTEGGVQKTYQFWVSGTKAEIATKNGVGELASSGASLATGTYSTPAAAMPLEARYRSWLESDGANFESTKFKGCKILFF